MSLLQKINAIWQKVGLVQRVLLIAIVTACIITASLLTKWATRPDMRLLFGSLSLEEASTIVDKINEKNIQYELKAGGTSIYAPSDKIFELRASLARDGLPQDSEPGYKVFDDEKLGVSPLVQKMNYNRALQGELAKTIQIFDGVLAARVHIVRPEQTVFTDDAQSATASVMLKLKPGWTVGPATIAAITNLVAGATEGLKAENVTVTDSNGRLLTSNTSSDGLITSANTYIDYKQRVEASIANSIQQLLEGPLGPGRSRVTVSAALNMTSTQTRETTYTKGMPIEETINSTSTVKEAATDADSKDISPGSTDKQDTSELKYKLPETITTKIEVPGQIVSLSISAFVDLSIPETTTPGEENQDAQPVAESTERVSIMTVEDVTAIIKNAVGPELLKDENSLTVKDVRFYQSASTTLDDAGKYEKLGFYMEIARHSSMGILAICALIVLKIFAGAKNKALTEETTAGTAQLDMLNTAMLPAAAGSANEPTLVLRRQIAGELRNNPEQVRQLFVGWLAEET
jgi:flagellar M-ring protein FliF